MIRVNDDWVIEMDPYNYILKKDLHKQTKQKRGTGYVMDDTYRTVGYFATLENALERLGEEIIKDRLSEASRTLPEAVAVIRECRDEWRELARKVVEA